MEKALWTSFADELTKIAVARIKSNDRMPTLSKKHVENFVQQVESWDSPHRASALEHIQKTSPKNFLEILHSARRWYTGQTMGHKLLEHRDSMSDFMDLKPEDAVGVYRGFKVPKDSPLAAAQVGQRLQLDVTRNGGLSSWSLSQDATNRFSGAGKGKVGLIVKLVDSEGIKPILAPPERTKPWFNELYSKVIGKSFRPTEGEYLIAAPSVHVEVVKVKK